MGIPYASFLASEPFRLNGPDGEVFYVHSKLAVQHSLVMDRLINGSMKEAREGALNITAEEGNIDDGTVMRFVEYAYTGDYTVPDPYDYVRSAIRAWKNTQVNKAKTMQLPNPVSEQQLADEEQANASDGTHSLTVAVNRLGIENDTISEISEPNANHNSVNNQQENDWAVFNESTLESAQTSEADPAISEKKVDLWYDFVSAAKIVRNWEPRKPSANGGSYHADILCHAQLYVFANYYDCRGLGELALQKLRLTLSRYDPSDGPEPLVCLAEYTFAHTMDYTNGRDRLRKLVCEYLVCHLEKMMKNVHFEELLRESEGLAAEVLRSSMTRLE